MGHGHPRASPSVAREGCPAKPWRSLHSYRYAWTERAKTVGYPERFAQLALGHNSKAVHRAYARKAQVTLPPLEEYERNAMTAPVIPLPMPGTG